MRVGLTCHRDSACEAITRIEVDVGRAPDGCLTLSYLVTGRIADLRIPPAVPAERSDGLWRHTCFEIFVRRASGAAYCEFNLAPSTQWAAYVFDDYRSGMRLASAVAPPRIKVQAREDRLTLNTVLRLPDMPADGPWRFAIAAVVEETNGRKSYWALAHPPGKPDFHHADCFALELPPA